MTEFKLKPESLSQRWGPHFTIRAAQPRFQPVSRALLSPSSSENHTSEMSGS